MTNLIVSGDITANPAVTLGEVRANSVEGFVSGYGMSKKYAAAMLAMFPFTAKNKKPLFCEESGAEFKAWKDAAAVAASKAGVDTGSKAFKAKLRDYLREVRKHAAIICGIDTGNGAKANEKRKTLDWLKEEAPKWLRRVNKDESGNAKVIKAYDALEKLCKELGLNPAEIIAKSET